MSTLHRYAALIGLSIGATLACGETELDSLGQSRIHPLLIDDLEDGDDQIPAAYGRHGGWYIFNDGTGSQTSDPPLPELDAQAPSGNHAMVTRGSGFEEWGAGLGVNVAGGDLSIGYDASEFSGIHFYARGRIDGESQILRVNFPSTQTGTMTSCEDLDCNNHFGKSITLTPTWQPYEIRFDELTQGVKLSETREFQTRIFRDIQFLISRQRGFELWVDELEFVR